MKPLVKWAGGKRQLMQTILNHVLPVKFDVYYEPFAGGLALLVELYNREKLGKAVISDVNTELINLYRVVKKSPHYLSEAIERWNFENKETSYYRYREKYNELIGHPGNEIDRAALFLYFNRHAYNGLWRVNKSGKFNVPFGKYENPSFPEDGHILEFSRLLQNVELKEMSFEKALKHSREGDFVYLDPPYFPVSETARFTDYTKEGFGSSDQERLYNVCKSLDYRGVTFLLSNSFTEEVSRLYSEFQSYKIEVRRSINSNAKLRTGHYEFLISNLECAKNSDSSLSSLNSLS